MELLGCGGDLLQPSLLHLLLPGQGHTGGQRLGRSSAGARLSYRNVAQISHWFISHSKELGGACP